MMQMAGAASYFVGGMSLAVGMNAGLWISGCCYQTGTETSRLIVLAWITGVVSGLLLLFLGFVQLRRPRAGLKPLAESRDMRHTE